MLLILSIFLAIFSGLTNPYVNRLDNVSIWIARVMSVDFTNSEEEKMSKSIASQFHNALRTGDSFLFNTFETLAPLSIIIGIIVGFFYAWWLGFLSFLIYIIISSLIELSNLYPKNIGHYLLFYEKRLTIRYANYLKNNDSVRAEAILETREDLEELINIYATVPIKVPSAKICKSCPYGDKFYLINLFYDSQH